MEQDMRRSIIKLLPHFFDTCDVAEADPAVCDGLLLYCHRHSFIA